MNAMRSLSVRLLALTVAVVLLTEMVVFLPALAQERRAWLREHLRDGDIAALAIGTTPEGVMDAGTRAALLGLTDADLIRLRNANGAGVTLSVTSPGTPERQLDLRKETALQSLSRALEALFVTGPPHMLLIGQSPRHPDKVVEVLVNGHHLSTALRKFARTNALEWLLIASMTGLLLYIALAALLVRPLRRMTGRIAAFRAAPERATAPDLMLVGREGDEISTASRELAAMQAEMRTALWRNARLAALGTAVAKVSHDLRGILSSAMLAADRLSTHADPSVQRAADVVVRAVERATELMRQTLEFAREGPPALSLARHALREIVAEAAETVPDLPIKSQISPSLSAEVDRLAVFRVLSNLMRNAQQAGATQIMVLAEREAYSLVILVADNGPGLPEHIKETLFRAFASGSQSSGLGLAIARDLMRAHGGDVVLDSTGPEGTVFRLLLPITESADVQ
jgi:signal transduction histidine kinase